MITFVKLSCICCLLTAIFGSAGNNLCASLSLVVGRASKMNQQNVIPSTVIDPSGSPVGIRYFRATTEHPPLRILYPADPTAVDEKPAWWRSHRKVGWFRDTGFYNFLEGYFAMAVRDKLPRKWMFSWIAVPFLRILSVIMPAAWKKIPHLHFNAPASKTNRKYPLVVFSHGLTGSGQENLLLCAAWAQRGFVVANVHHQDGSSCKVQLADGSWKYYQSAPSMDDSYDLNFRPNQVEIRANEMKQAYDFVTSTNSKDGTSSMDQDSPSSACPTQISNLIDPKGPTIAAGFSFGAATAARVCTMSKSPFTAAILLDGWFHIQLTPDIDFCFPQSAFESNSRLGTLPALFLNSQQFQGYSRLFAATQQLAAAGRSKRSSVPKVHVVPGTGHQSFCDVLFWFWPLPSKWWTKALSLGKAEPVLAYQEIVQRTCNFLEGVRDSQLKFSKIETRHENDVNKDTKAPMKDRKMA